MKNPSFKIPKFIKYLYYTVVLIGFSQHMFSQTGVLISPTSGTADSSAMLEVKSTSLGLLIPRMTTAQRDAITSPAIGLVIYNSTTNEFNYYNNNWIAIPTGSGVLPVSNGGTGQTSFSDGELLIGNSIGNTLTKSTLTAGSGISVTNAGGSITIANTSPSSGGTVTSTSVTSTNGFSGTVNNPTTTPAISIGTTVTGILKGNGLAISTATAGTDYLAPNTTMNCSNKYKNNL